MSEYKIDEINEVEANSFLSHMDRVLYQQYPDFINCLNNHGYRIKMLALYEDEVPVLYAKINLTQFMRYFKRADIGYGPIFDHSRMDLLDEFLKLLPRYLKEKEPRVTTIFISPMIAKNLYSGFQLISSGEDGETADQIFRKYGYKNLSGDFYTNHDIYNLRNFYSKDISGMSLNDVLASCTQAVRYNIKSAEKYSIKVEYIDDPSQLDSYYKAIQDSAIRNGVGDIPCIPYHKYIMNKLNICYILKAYMDCNYTLSKFDELLLQAKQEVEKAKKKLEQRPDLERAKNKLATEEKNLEAVNKKIEEVKDLQAKYGNIIPMAYSSFYESPSDMVYLESGTYREFMPFHAIYAIHKEMLQKSIEHGVRFYNFFGISGDITEDAPDIGVIQFKNQFRGNREEWIGTYTLDVAHSFEVKILKMIRKFMKK